MYFGSKSVADEQLGKEKKMWLAVRPVVNLQTFKSFSSTYYIFNTTATAQHNLWSHKNLYN